MIEKMRFWTIINIRIRALAMSSNDTRSLVKEIVTEIVADKVDSLANIYSRGLRPPVKGICENCIIILF